MQTTERVSTWLLILFGMFKFEIQSCVRGYHIYQAFWSSSVGEMLNCAREPRNREDLYAVDTRKAGDVVVGHIPCKVSHVFSTFLQHDGLITCTITRVMEEGIQVIFLKEA